MCDDRLQQQSDSDTRTRTRTRTQTSTITDTIQGFQERLHLEEPSGGLIQMQQHNSTEAYFSGGGGRSGFMFPADVPPILPWHLPQVQHGFNPIRDHHHDPFLLPPAPSVPYVNLFNRRPPGLQFSAYDGSSSEHLRLITHDGLGQIQTNSAPFGLQAELQKMTAQEIMDAKALAASKSHSEAERRRRERINNHLAKLRSLLPNTTKTDKASLLAEVIQHVKELKRQTSLIAESTPVPTEIDELTVDNASDEDGKWVIRASLCCEDRSDLLPDLIKTLKSLRLRTLKAEITTLGGRVKNVLFITNDDDAANMITSDDHDHQDHQQQHSISSIQEALKAVMEKTNGDDPQSGNSGNVKRQRTNINILEHRSL